MAGSVGGSQGLSGSVGAIAGSAGGPDRRRAERDSKRRELTSESERALKTPGLRTVAERKRPNDQERGRLEAIAGPGGNPTAPRKVSRRRNLPRQRDLVVLRMFGGFLWWSCFS